MLGALLAVLSAHLILVFPANVLGLVAGFACYVQGLGRCGTAREGFLTGSLFGLLLAAGSLSWLGDVLHVLTPAERFVGVLVVGGFLLLVALPYGLWGLVAPLLARRSPRLGLLLQAPGLLLTQALIHDAGLGFPWLHHGYWLASGPLRAWLGLLGAWGSGLLVLHLAASLGHWRRTPQASAHALVTVAVLALGARVPTLAPAVPGARPLQAAVIALTPTTREDSQQDDVELLARYVAASRKTRAPLLLWPESVIRDGASTLGPLGGLLGLPGRKVFAGALLPAPEGRYNTLVEVQSGQPVYYKQQRVPFSEYVPGAPLRRLFAALHLNTLKTDVRAWEGPQPDLRVDGVRLIPLICYESAFAGHVRPGEEPTVLLHVGNEHWFRGGLMHRMSLAQSLARASEHGLPLVRATAGGYSGFFDPAAEPPWKDAGSHLPEVSQQAAVEPRRAATLYSWLRRNEPFQPLPVWGVVSSGTAPMNRLLGPASLGLSLLALTLALWRPGTPEASDAPPPTQKASSSAPSPEELKALARRVQALEDNTLSLSRRLMLLEQRPVSSDGGTVAPAPAALAAEVEQLRMEVRGMVAGEALQSQGGREYLKDMVRSVQDEIRTEQRQERMAQFQQAQVQAQAQQSERWRQFAAEARLSYAQEQALQQRLETESTRRQALLDEVRAGTRNPRELRQELRALRSQTDQEMHAVLDEAQRAQYDALRREERQQERPGRNREQQGGGTP